jgi:5-methylthioadenosine/S-adenosylhomocysteine deaminase
MRYLFEGATVLTMDDADRVLDSGWVAVEDGAIISVTPTAPDRWAPDRRIDARHKVIMPGIVNAHTHLYQVLIRGVYEHLPFIAWLRSIYYCGRTLTAEECYVSARLGTLESIRSGVTTLVDHHFLNRGEELPEATLAGMREMGVRTVLARVIMDLGDLAPPEVVETPEQGLRSVERLLDAHRAELGDGMLTLMTGPNTPGVSASAELARETKRWADARGLRLSAHIAESTSVVDAVKRRYGVDGVVRWLDQAEALGPTLVAPHSVHLTPDEVRIYAQRGVSVSHNPISNMFLGDGVAPVVQMLEAGVNVALGTDGAASNNTQDMFQVLKAAPLLQRAHNHQPHAIQPMQALRMATRNGAKALGLDHLVGSLEPGKRADLIVLDLYRAPRNVAVHNIPSHLVHCAMSADVELVMVDGRVLMENGEVAGVDEPRLLHEAQQVGERLVQRLS